MFTLVRRGTLQHFPQQRPRSFDVEHARYVRILRHMQLMHRRYRTKLPPPYIREFSLCVVLHMVLGALVFSTKKNSSLVTLPLPAMCGCVLAHLRAERRRLETMGDDGNQTAARTARSSKGVGLGAAREAGFVRSADRPPRCRHAHRAYGICTRD
jgi:hypothetical protein